MENLDFLKKTLEIESIIQIGERISWDLEIASNTLRDNFAEFEEYFLDQKSKETFISKELLNYVRKTLKSSELNIEKFESELEMISNYNREDEILDLDLRFLDKLNFSSTMNLYLRMELEEYLVRLDIVKGIIEGITTNLNKQKSDKLLASNILM